MAQQAETESATQKGVALVTGAADRIGAAMARALAKAGYKTLIHYNASAEKAAALVADLRGSGAIADTIGADLRNRNARDQLIVEAEDIFGPLTVLVNNASLFQPDSPQTLQQDLWDAHFALHAEAPVFLAGAFANRLPQGIKGNIVNLIDERVWRLAPSYFSYTLSKSVLWTATQTLAQNLAPRIRVNAIGPGPTVRNDRQTEAEFQRSVEALPLRTQPDPEQIARALLFILDTPSLTGQMLALDGGEHLMWRPERGPTPAR